MVGELDLQSGGPEFKSSSLPLGGFLFGGPRVKLLRAFSAVVLKTLMLK